MGAAKQQNNDLNVA